jgi:hypothetical protein
MKRLLSTVVAGLTVLGAAGCVHVERVQPAASPGTTTIVVTPGSPTTVVTAAAAPWCRGAYAPNQGSNFGACTPSEVR